MLRESHEDNLKNFLLFIVIMLYNQMIITPQAKNEVVETSEHIITAC